MPFFIINLSKSSPKEGKSILDVFPNEIMDKFFIAMDLITLTKAASSNKYMTNLKIIRQNCLISNELKKNICFSLKICQSNYEIQKRRGKVHRGLRRKYTIRWI